MSLVNNISLLNSLLWLGYALGISGVRLLIRSLTEPEYLMVLILSLEMRYWSSFPNSLISVVLISA